MASTPAAGRHFTTLASCVLVATILATLSTQACGGGDNNANGTDASGDENIKLLCETFSGSGTPCSPVSDQRCFAMCATGGCKCVAGNGGGVWKCETDETCYPGGPDFDAAQDEASVATDAGTGDAQSDGASDATTDALIDDAGDAGD
jgi:hypothetical protein